MPLLLVRGLRYGLGMASEAIYDARGRNSTPDEQAVAEPEGQCQADSDESDLTRNGSWSQDSQAQGVSSPIESKLYQSHSETAPSPAVFEGDCNTAEAYEEAEDEEQRVKERIVMTRSLAALAGPAPEVRPIHPLQFPVIIPQRRARDKARGFLPVYSPVLEDCGISQDVFVQFIENMNTVNRCDGWLEATCVAAQVVGTLPFASAAIVGAIVAVIAGIGKEFQIRHRKNSLLEMVNREIFIPRGVCAIVMTFRDKVRGSGFGRMNRLFSTEPVSNDNTDTVKSPLEEAATNAVSVDQDGSTVKKAWKNMSKLSSGKTYTEIELPETAPLVFMKDAGCGETPGGTLDKMRSARQWLDDYKDRRANIGYTVKHPESRVVGPINSQKPLRSRFNDPNHPANSGSLISLLSGGHIPVPGADQIVGKGRRMVVDMVQGQKPSADAKPIDGLGLTVLNKLTTEDVVYLMVVNVPTDEEIRNSITQLDGIMDGTGYAEDAESDTSMLEAR